MATLPTSIAHAAWGVENNLPAPFDACVITDYSETRETQQQYEYDQKGAVCGCVKYDTRVAISATIQVPNNITLPDEGSLLTVDKQVFILTSITINQNNRDYRKVSIALERFSNAFDTTNVNDLTTENTAS